MQNLLLKLNGNDIQLIANPVVRGEKTEGAVILLVDVTEKLRDERICEGNFPQMSPMN